MAQFIASLVTIVIVANVILLSVAYCILLERKIASWVQDRIGPNRVGFNFGQEWLPTFSFWGLGQPLADGLKFVFKEDFNPEGVDPVLFRLAPVLVIVPALLSWAVIPWGGFLDANSTFLGFRITPTAVAITAANVNIGIVYILAISSLAVYGVVLGGYASNNKYSFLGGLRATAQMLSYEIPMALSVLIVVLMTGAIRPDLIVAVQVEHNWLVFQQPLLAIVFFTCVLAECNRAPFDLAEAEQELVGGYHTEYSSMKFALFFLGEYMHMITGSAFFVLLFLGGWHVLPWAPEPATGGLGLVVFRCLTYAVKVFLMIALMMMIRWTLPRFRFDQLMRLAWRSLIPMTLLLLLGASAVVYLGVTPWWNLLINALVLLGAVVIGPLLPQGPPVNRRVGLAGSRYSPPRPA